MKISLSRAAVALAIGSFMFTAFAKEGPTSAPARLDIQSLERDRMLRMANEFLAGQPVTVTASHSPRSEGGLHDFFSEGDYWWPDPKNPDGPYIQKDGMTNPDNFVEHRKALMGMSVKVATLTAAYKITGDRKYADAAVKHLTAWFVNPDTMMNPNLEYAQAIHGRFKGRGTGIIDTIHLIEPARSVIILENAGVLKGEELAGIRKWFSDYILWLTTSKNGSEEMNAKNNHGSCFWMQLSAFAKLAGDEKELEAARRKFKEVLLPNQMAPDGSFPQELRRTKPYSYSMFNLDAMCTLCEIASTPQDNLWAFTLPDGRSMKKGEEFMAPYIQDKDAWLKFLAAKFGPGKGPDVMFWDKWPVRSASLLFAGQAYGEQKWMDLWVSLPADYSNEEVLRNVPIRTPVLWVGN
ncbi:MAG TPA: alginate lyase family protein [Phycisphaerae bacterium]|nr:alginate lyase family protein [Phycisphaerae bacterium]